MEIKVQDSFLEDLSVVKQAASNIGAISVSLAESSCTEPTKRFNELCVELTEILREYEVLLQHDMEQLDQFYRGMQQLDQST